VARSRALIGGLHSNSGNSTGPTCTSIFLIATTHWRPRESLTKSTRSR
jgi:hypothetical protein